MTALILDTSSDTTYVAVAKEGQLVELKTFSDIRQLSKFLLPSIASLWQAWDFIALGIGPGSYTGTRVGATIAKTFSFALKIPVVTFSSHTLPDIEGIARLTHEKFTSCEFDSQIELVYFPKTS